MNPIQIFMITVFFGSIGMIIAIVLCKRSEERTDTLRDCLLWGTGFFVAMCLQVLALSRF